MAPSEHPSLNPQIVRLPLILLPLPLVTKMLRCAAPPYRRCGAHRAPLLR